MQVSARQVAKAGSQGAPGIPTPVRGRIKPNDHETLRRLRAAIAAVRIADGFGYLDVAQSK